MQTLIDALPYPKEKNLRSFYYAASALSAVPVASFKMARRDSERKGTGKELPEKYYYK